MSYLPYTAELGQLDTVEVYIFYDGPKLFVCRSRTDQLYLALWAGEANRAESWLLVPMSERRFQFVRSGAVELRDAFLHPEEGRVYELSVTADYENPQVESLVPQRLNTEVLPLPGEALCLETMTLPNLSRQDPAVEARHLRREVVDLTLQLPGERRNEAPADLLGTALMQVQKVLDAIAQAMFGEVTRRAPIPQDVRRHSRLAVAGTFGGSFGVRLVARQPVDLFDYSETGDVISEFLRLVAAGSKQAELLRVLEPLEARVAARYRVLLETLSAEDTGMALMWGSPRRQPTRREHLDAVGVRAAALAVNAIEQHRPVEHEMRCLLIGINVRTKSYEIWDTDSERKYSGRVLDSAMPQVEHATVNEEYTAIVQEIVEMLSGTGEERTKWRLAGLRPVQGSTAPHDEPATG